MERGLLQGRMSLGAHILGQVEQRPSLAAAKTLLLTLDFIILYVCIPSGFFQFAGSDLSDLLHVVLLFLIGAVVCAVALLMAIETEPFFPMAVSLCGGHAQSFLL